MRDLLNIQIVLLGLTRSTALWEIRHKTREGLRVEFEAPNPIEEDKFKEVFENAVKKYSEKYSSMSQKSMTAPQKNYYDKLVEFHKMEGRAPSYEEQCLMLNVRSKGTPHHYAKALERGGHVWFDGRSVIPFEIAEPNLEDSHE
jgi:hypothetical protein